MNRYCINIINIILTSLMIASLSLLSACASVPGTSRSTITQRVKKLNNQDRTLITQIAQKAIGSSSIKTPSRSFRADCSGTVRGIYWQAKIPLGGVLKTKADNDVKAIYRFVRKYGHIIKNDPLPGDLVFFHNTYDRSRNGRMNDALTHIGVVEKIEGTLVYFVHHLGRTIIRSRMDLSKPTVSIDTTTNKRLNHVLRRAHGSYPSYTAAQLFAGFGRL